MTFPRVSRRAALTGGLALAATGALPRAAFAAEKSNVVVIGAGLSGLNAATILADQGASVTVLECSPRVGGRVYTGYQIEGRPEFGASQVGPMYARVRDMARRLDVKFGDGANIYAPYALSLDGKLMRASEWESSPLNKTVGFEREVVPSALSQFFLAKFNPFKELDDWLSPDAHRYDIAYGDWLRQVGASPAAIEIIGRGLVEPNLRDVSALTSLQEVGRSLRDTAGGGDSRKTDIFQQFGQKSSHVIGGSSKLVEAMAANLKGAVKTGKRVAAIEMTATGAEVRCTDGSRYAADHVVVALPFVALRKIAISPGLPGAQGDAVREMPYGGQSQVWMRVKAPYWEADGYDASLWSDGLISLFRQSIDYDGSRKDAVAISSGDKARQLDKLPPAERGRFVLDELARLRPSTKGKLEVVGIFSWSEDPYVGGCRHSYRPGQMTRFRPVIDKPYGRMHFAGEHTRRLEVGMESAMETGERAALEVIGA